MIFPEDNPLVTFFPFGVGVYTSLTSLLACVVALPDFGGIFLDYAGMTFCIAGSHLKNITRVKMQACALTSLWFDAFTQLVSVTSLDLSTNSLTSIPSVVSMPFVGIDTANGGLNLNNNALTSTVVDQILSGLVLNGQLNGLVDVSGGTSGAPSTTGLNAAAILAGKGWTVLHN